MEPSKQTSTTAANEQDTIDHMKSIVAEYDLPESYQSLVNGPWRLVAQTVSQQFGEDSDAWSRMTWFTRILCTAIETSLSRHTPDAVNDALNGFSIWLNSLREEGDAYSMCVSAANYAQRRISTQITEDTAGEAEAVHVNADSDEAFVLPGEEAIDLEPLSDEPDHAPQNELAELDSAEEATSDSLEPADDAVDEKPVDPLDSLSLSLAYSANEDNSESTEVQSLESELPETTEKIEEDTYEDIDEKAKRGKDMEAQTQSNLDETPAPAFDSKSGSETAKSATASLTDAASISPVPMGTWLAFHDQDLPTLARLAMYDTADETFMLGNKSGILVRKIGKSELDALIESGLVQRVEFQSING